MGILHDLDGYVGDDTPKEENSTECIISDIMEAGLSYENGFTAEDADPEELKMGIIVEMEHTSNKEISEKIALDHLCEISDYYTRLSSMEQEAGRSRD